jgi:hypothetical protein
MRVAIRIESRPGMYLAALYRDKPTFTPLLMDACSFRDDISAETALGELRRLGYAPKLEDVAW